MSKLNPAYVLAPFQTVITSCQNNVLMGLRIVERINELPGPTPEELQFFQLSFGAPSTNLEKNRSAFKRWLLLNGFQDIVRSIRVGLERLFVFETTKARLQKSPHIQIDDLEKELYAKGHQVSLSPTYSRGRWRFQRALRISKACRILQCCTELFAAHQRGSH